MQYQQQAVLRYIHMKKFCPGCKSEKNSLDFTKDSTKSDGRHRLCKKCKRETDKKYSSSYIADRKERNRKRAERATAYLQQVKSTGCIKCPEREVVALDLHHLDPLKKEFAFSAYRNASIEKLKTEVQKCVVICSNCHRKLHAGLIKLGD